jgi:tetraprenyl-beta-curcumene synthase
VPSPACLHPKLAADFLRLGRQYWLGIYPQVVLELARWRHRATTIPDPTLRGHALATHRDKRRHAEGAAAFAIIAPSPARPRVVRCLVAFQAMYDYLDTISEQPGTDPLLDGWQLHMALVDALTPGAPHSSAYALHPQCDDGGYLASFVDACRSACSALPAFSVVAPTVRLAARRAMRSQGYNHALATASPPLAPEAVTRWARSVGDERHGLSWWEVVGAAGSSLAILALVAAAADPTLDRAEGDAVYAVYFPWAGAVLALIDSLVDQAHDATNGTHSLVSRYPSSGAAADRLGALASRALALTNETIHPERHALIVASMVALFASAPGAQSPRAHEAIHCALKASGPRTALPLIALRAKRKLDSRRAGSQ